MQNEFFKKKKHTVSKATNIEIIQQEIQNSEQQNCGSAEGSKNVITKQTKENVLEIGKIQKKQRSKAAKKLDDFSFISENNTNDNSFIVDNVKIFSYSDSKHNEILLTKDRKIKGEDSNTSKRPKMEFEESILAQKIVDRSIHITSNQSSTDLRKMRIMNYATRKVDIKYSLSDSALYLSKNLKQLSTLYKIILSVHSFNQKRGLTLIFSKYSDSIERLFKHRVEIELLERLNFICREAIVFCPLTISDLGEKKNTFTINFKDNFDIDMALFNFYLEEYGKWLESKGIEGKVNKFHPDFLEEDVIVPKKIFLPEIKVSSLQEQPMNINEIVKKKSDNIIERLKEKERLRKEQFIRECTVERDYESKILSIFSVSGKKAIKLDDIVFNIGGFDCKSHVLRNLKDKFILKTIDGIEFVILKNESEGNRE